MTNRCEYRICSNCYDAEGCSHACHDGLRAAPAVIDWTKVLTLVMSMCPACWIGLRCEMHPKDWVIAEWLSPGGLRWR